MVHEEFEFKFRVESEADLQTLVRRVAGPDAALPPAVRQVNHFFDTPGWDLGATNRILRLREEPDRFFLTAKGPGSRESDDALSVKAEEEVTVTPDEARAILDGAQSPLPLLVERCGSPRPPLLEAMSGVVGDDELREIGAFANHRRRLDPVPLSTDLGPVDVVFELDRTEFPGGVIHHEIEVEVAPRVADACRVALLELLLHSGIVWRPSTSKARRFFDLLRDGAAP